MIDYIEVTVPLLDERKEIIIAELTNLGFEGIWDRGNDLVAYIPKDQFRHKELYDTLAKYQMENSFSYSVMEQKNWNEEWEKNYEPIWVDTRVYVRSPFHEAANQVDHEIVIQPKMSFGTGHHETTRLMIRMMLTVDFTGKKVLDMGTGTGVLAFLASKMKANEVLGIDNDENAVENAHENMKYNEVGSVKFLHGSQEAIEPGEYDIVLSNITKNINMGLLPSLAKIVSKEGYLMLAGFLNFDLKEVNELATSLGLTLVRNISEGDWECLLYKK